MQTTLSQGNQDSLSTLSSDSINSLTGTISSEITQYFSEEEEEEEEEEEDYDDYDDLGSANSADARSVLSTSTRSSTVNPKMRAHLEALRHGATVLKIDTKTILSTFASKKIYSSECRLALRALQEYTKFNRLRGMKIYNLVAKEYHSHKVKKEIIRSISMTAIAEPTTSCEAILQLLRYGVGDFDSAVRVRSFSSISKILHTNAKGERGNEYVANILKNVNSVTSCILDAFPMIFKHSDLTFAEEDLWKDVVHQLLVMRELDIAYSIVKANTELLSARSFAPINRLFRNGHFPAAAVLLAIMAEKAMIISSDCIGVYGWWKNNMCVDQMTLLADYRLVKALFRSSLRVSSEIWEDYKALHARIFLNRKNSGCIARTLNKRDANIYLLYCSILRKRSNSIVNEIAKLSKMDSQVFKQAGILWSFAPHPDFISDLEKLSIPEKSSIVLAYRFTGQSVWHSLAEQTVIHQLMESERRGKYSLMQSAKYAIYESVPIPSLISPLVRLCFSANHSISMGAMHLLNYTILKNTGDLCMYFVAGILSVDYSVSSNNDLDDRRVSLILFPEVWTLLKKTTSLELVSIFRIIVAHDQFNDHRKSLLLDCARHPRVDSCEFDELRSMV